MSFDLENAVQQGFNRDVTTNDWHVEARNLEIKLDDHGGVREFRILDNENVGVFVTDSDGYLSIAGNAEIHGGHVLVKGEGLTNSEYLTLQDETEEVSVHLFDLNPDGTVSGEQGSFGTNYNDGYLYVNTDGAQKWERLAMVSQIPNLEGNIVAHSDLTGIGTDDHHAESHNIASHSDTTATGTELETLTDGSTTTLHNHAVGSHNIASHSDTTATGTELDTLTDGSSTTLHNHTHANATGKGTDDHHAQSHNIASHSDTTATGTELDTLTDGSTTTLHNHTATTPTLQDVYDNDTDGGDATITTDATDGAVVIAGDQKLKVTATGGFDLDTGFDMDGAGPFDVDITGAVSIDADSASNITVDGADLTLSTTTSGDINVTIPDGPGDFILTDAGSSQYIRTNTGNGELILGDASTPVFTTVMNNMEVLGNFIVQGTTTTLNTQELYVEDRLIRLNSGSPDSNFSGNVGIEAEVGADGYVEFHWDDTQGRWELSIDRNTTPEAQTFRPLAYLADGPATLDLSDIGDGGWPTSGPNPSAGASVINTNLTNFPRTFGPNMTDDSVQAALEAIDGYLSDIASGEVEFYPFTQVKGLDINGCVLNGVGKVWTSAGTPGLQFSSGGTSRASWSLPVPADWDGESDIVVEFVWAPSDAGSGDVSWRLEYKSLALTELASSASSNVDYDQATGGTADAIQTTNVELAIPAASIDASDEIMVVNAVRRGSAAADTYSGKAYVYLVKYSYTAKNIV